MLVGVVVLIVYEGCVMQFKFVPICWQRLGCSSVADWPSSRHVHLYKRCCVVCTQSLPHGQQPIIGLSPFSILCCCGVGTLPHGDQLVIGLNPPFGKNNSLAQAFVMHAASFRPSVIILIVPPGTNVPIGYNVDYDDEQTMANR